MPSAPFESLPPLAPLGEILRPLSSVERYHASIGTHPDTLEEGPEVCFVIEARSTIEPAQWQCALEAAAQANPGARLRLHGQRSAAHWRSDGPMPRLRVVENCDWDARSSVGAGFIRGSELSLTQGPTVELVLAPRRDGSTLLALRTPHAVMDGIGYLHFLHEIFRALRGEPLLGSNTAFSDVQLMRSGGVKKSTSKHIRTCGLTGEPQGDERGDDWRRISLGKPKKNQLARLAVALAAYAHRSSALPALMALPVNLRRHVPGMNTTTNFTSMLLVRLDPGDGVDVFRARLEAMLAGRMDTFYPAPLDLVRYLPLPWIDRMVSRTPANYRQRKPMETAVISNLGRFNTANLSAPGFEPYGALVTPVSGNAFATLSCINDHVDLVLNLSRVRSSNGRFDALEAWLRDCFAD
jgi:hypothetical protein